MEIINILIFIVVSSYILVNPRGAILFMTVWFLALSMFIIPPPLPNFNFLFGLCMIAYIILFAKKGSDIKNATKYPFWTHLVLYSISSVITLIFAPFMLGLFAEIQDVFSGFVFPFVLWCAIKKDSDIKQIISLFVAYAVILSLYGFYEAFTNTNPYIEFLMNNNLVNESVGISDRMRFGFRRIQSFLTYNNALCVNCSLWIIIIAFKKYFPLYYNNSLIPQHFDLTLFISS